MPQTISISSQLDLYEDWSELPASFQHLAGKAREACEKAYAPYSNFFVGAALLLSDGQIITGNNQENAAYPSGVCAERTAFYWAGANYPQARILAAAVAARRADSQAFLPITPCGACRQAMLEYEVKQGTPIPLLLDAGNGQWIVAPSIGSLLPLKFEQLSLVGGTQLLPS